MGKLWSAVLRSLDTSTGSVPFEYAYANAWRAKLELNSPPTAPSTTFAPLSAAYVTASA